MLLTVPAAWALHFVPRPEIVPYVVEDMFLGGCLILGGGIEKINVISKTPWLVKVTPTYQWENQAFKASLVLSCQDMQPMHVDWRGRIIGSPKDRNTRQWEPSLQFAGTYVTYDRPMSVLWQSQAAGNAKIRHHGGLNPLWIRGRGVKAWMDHQSGSCARSNNSAYKQDDASGRSIRIW